MKIALLQAFFKTGDPAYNAEVLLKLTREAARRGAEFCIAPELAICGPMPKDLLLRKEFVEACRVALANLATELKGSAALLLGSPMFNPVPRGRPAHNCAVLIKDGKVRIASRKVLLANEDVVDEHRYFEPGMASGVFDLSGWRFAVVMADDTVNDPSLFNNTNSVSEGDPVAECLGGGADALICLGALPFSAHRISLQKNILAGLAARYRIPSIFVNHVGAVDGNVFPGASAAFDHTGAPLAAAELFSEETVMLDLAAEKGQLLGSEESEQSLLWRALVLGVQRYVEDSDFKQVVLGLSGGIDSALVAAIAARAIGPKNVTGVLMPSPYTSTQSTNDAIELSHELGINYLTIPITPLMQAYAEALSAAFKGLPAGGDTTQENIQARIRGNLLMALANKNDALLLCTSNKSELAVGFGTLYGDMSGALAVLGDLYKTEVFELTRWYNKKHKKKLIPAAILEREPSAELKPDQKDSDVLPPYEILDVILESYIEKGLPASKINVPGVSAATVRQVLSLLDKAEFKRAQAPPVIRVSDRGFGFGWRRPLGGNNTSF